MPSQLLTSDFTSCSQPPQVTLAFVETDVQYEIFKICVFTCPTINFCRILFFYVYMKPGFCNQVYTLYLYVHVHKKDFRQGKYRCDCSAAA